MTQFDHSSTSLAPPTSLVIVLRQLFKTFCLFALLSCGVMSACKIACADTLQHRWAGDVPIMSGFAIEPELGFAFDSPNGRIVMIFASSAAAAPDIMRFYNESLPAIGWMGGDGNWRRDSEVLLISEVTTAAGRLWRLMVRPH